MRLLLDENLPKRLKLDFPNHEIFTVREKGWNGIKNGELLQIMVDKNFDALLTFDKNLQHQQNFLKYPIAVFVLTAFNNTYFELSPLTPHINQILETGILKPGVTVISLHNSPT
jgi:predicted nuclease of predicted toxin-antitoxin system